MRLRSLWIIDRWFIAPLLFPRGKRRGRKGRSVDSHVTPEPWAMPGYEDPVIMAAGTFTMGASLELSADGPIRPPYSVWLQGGLTYGTGKLGLLLAARAIAER